MPSFTFKRKEPLVKAVRRGAVRHLNVVIEALTRPGQSAKFGRELARLDALVQLFRGPLGPEVYRRESRVLTRAFQSIQPAGAIGQAEVASRLTALASEPPAIPIDGLLETPASVTAERPQASDESKEPGGRGKRGAPDPDRLRLMADLAEMRMRARYWHLPDGGFEQLSPGLRRSYNQAAKAAESLSTSGRAAPPDGSGAAGDAAAQVVPGAVSGVIPGVILGKAVVRLAVQIQSFERVWPDGLQVYPRELRGLADALRERAVLTQLPQCWEGHAQERELETRRQAAALEWDGTIRLASARLFAETPAAFVKRLGAYWAAWRGED
ncbi:MAG: hypothetical protein AAGG38_04640 [Planctomycetota bacterium]